MLMCVTTLNLSGPGENQPTFAPADATGFLFKTLEYDGQKYAYNVYVPPEYVPDKPWPCVLFLHGSGERGSDGLMATEVGIASAIRRHRSWFPAIVVIPQCRREQSWIGPDGLGPMGRMALKCVEDTSRRYHLDRDRLYLTGLSLGGQGAWLLAAMMPEQFAAVVPVCGFIEWGESTGIARKLAPRFVNQNIWTFHGDADKAVSVEKTRELVSAIRAAGGDVRYTEYAGVGHNSWDRAYNSESLWRWMFAQKRGQKAASETKPAAP
jgi:predicted peptidase